MRAPSIKTKGILFLCLSVLWMGFIFYMSSQTAEVSGADSGAIVKFIENAVPSFKSSGVALYLETIVRKCAHFFEYSVLGFLVFGFFNYKSVSPKAKILFSALVCTVYAVSDEVHQLFVEGRACRAYDVLIDFFGSVVGIFAFLMLTYIAAKRQKSR